MLKVGSCCCSKRFAFPLVIGIAIGIAFLQRVQPALAVDGVVERPIAIQPRFQGGASVYGNRIVWGDQRNVDSDVYMYDLAAGVERRITTNAANQVGPVIWGDKIVWTDWRNGYYNDDVYLYDLSANQERQITTRQRHQGATDIYGDKIVFADNQLGGQSDLYVYDLSTNLERPISTGPSHIGSGGRIFGDHVVWSDNRHGENDWDVFMYDLSTKTERAIAVGSGNQVEPDIWGNTIVWADNRDSGAAIPGFSEIYAYDLTTEEETRVTHFPTIKNSVAIQGDRIVWEENRGGRENDIFMYDLAAKRECQLTDDPNHQGQPSIFDNTVVWTDTRNSGWYIEWDLYMADISGLFPAISSPYQTPTSTAWGSSSQARVQMHAHYIDDISGAGKWPGAFSISEDELLRKYMRAGYGFSFVTEHDPINFGVVTMFNGPWPPSARTKSSESTAPRHHVLAYGIDKTIRSTDLDGQLGAIYSQQANASGYSPLAVAGHPNARQYPWGGAELAYQSTKRGPFGVEVYNGSLPYRSDRWALDKWNLVLYQLGARVYATAGDDFTPGWIGHGSTSVMIPGVAQGMPAIYTIRAWNNRTKDVVGKLRTGEFYASVGEPLRFNEIKVESRKVVVDTEEPCTITFRGTRNGKYDQELSAVGNTTHAEFAPVSDNRYVYVLAQTGERYSISQPIWVDKIAQNSVLIPKVKSSALSRLFHLVSVPETVLSVDDATLTVPSQASDVTVTARTLPATERPDAPDCGYLSNCYEISPKTASLDPVANLSVAFDALARQLYGPSNLAIFRYNESTKEWEELASTADESAGVVQASISSLGIYALSVKEYIDAISPEISISTPSAGETLSATRTIDATATDNVGIFKVSFRLDEVPLGDDLFGDDGYSAAYDFSKIAQGPHRLYASAEDVKGNTAETSVAVSIDSTTTPPSVAFTSPESGSAVSGAIHIAGTNSAEATRVAIALDGNPLGETVPASDAFSVDGGYWPTGNHTLAASAFDEIGNHFSETIRVSGPPKDSTAPTITNLTQDITVTSGETVTVQSQIDDSYVVSSAFLVFTEDDTQAYDLVPFEGSSGSYEATIPAYKVGFKGLDYYIAAQDPDANTALLPSNAPVGHFHIGVLSHTSIGASVSSGAVYYGSSAKLAASARLGESYDEESPADAAAPLRIEQRKIGSSGWSFVATRTASSTGLATYVVKPTSHREYRVLRLGDASHLAGISNAPRIYVRFKPVLSRSAYRVRVGRSVRFSGYVSPTRYSRYRYAYLQKYTSRGWRSVKRVRLSSRGRYAFYYRERTRGYRKFRLYQPGSSKYRSGYSSIRSARWY